jgi:hypothetical protein
MVYFTLSQDGEFRQGVSVSRQLGDTDVIVSEDPANPAAALICCGCDLYRVLHSGESYSFPSIVKILFKTSGTVQSNFSLFRYGLDNRVMY